MSNFQFTCQFTDQSRVLQKNPEKRPKKIMTMLKVTSLRDCLEEVIARGSGLFMRSYNIPGAHRKSEWDPAELLAELELESPGVLADAAWGEWVTRPGIGLTYSINYGRLGFSASHQEVPGYGRLRALEVAQRHGQDALPSLGSLGAYSGGLRMLNDRVTPRSSSPIPPSRGNHRDKATA